MTGEAPLADDGVLLPKLKDIGPVAWFSFGKVKSELLLADGVRAFPVKKIFALSWPDVL